MNPVMPIHVRDNVPPHVIPDMAWMSIDTAPKAAHQVGTAREPATQAHACHLVVLLLETYIATLVRKTCSAECAKRVSSVRNRYTAAVVSAYTEAHLPVY